jgi:hypothetical protein
MIKNASALLEIDSLSEQSIQQIKQFANAATSDSIGVYMFQAWGILVQAHTVNLEHLPFSLVKKETALFYLSRVCFCTNLLCEGTGVNFAEVLKLLYRANAPRLQAEETELHDRHAAMLHLIMQLVGVSEGTDDPDVECITTWFRPDSSRKRSAESMFEDTTATLPNDTSSSSHENSCELAAAAVIKHDEVLSKLYNGVGSIIIDAIVPDLRRDKALEQICFLVESLGMILSVDGTDAVQTKAALQTALTKLSTRPALTGTRSSLRRALADDGSSSSAGPNISSLVTTAIAQLDLDSH